MMNRNLIALLVVIFASCQTEFKETSTERKVVIHDTVRIVEKVIDTVVIEEKIDTIFMMAENEVLNSNNVDTTSFYIRERLPDWFLKTKILKDIRIDQKYLIDNRLNPLYLEEDFNGDGHSDIAVPIKEIESQKTGFAIVHGNTNQLFIIGAGVKIKDGLSDSMNYIDIWKINREKRNEPGLDENGEIDKAGPLILENPSLNIQKSEVGGGQIYWNGKEYVYFHQTC